MSELAFTAFSLNGVDAQKFLQGQVTVHVERLALNESRYTAICDLKGRIHFGLWIKKLNKESFELVTTHDQAEEFAKHIKKFGAFSKMKLEEIGSVFPTIHGIQTEFSSNETDIYTWQIEAIKSGQAWISKTTEHLFQPQELRLHQRDGVHFDKGCYLGQEIVARLWFKAKPKHWLHLIHAKGDLPAPATQLNKDVEVVNSVNINDGYLALVIAKPTALEELGLDILDLPEALNGDVARPS
ncbi:MULTISPECIES: CAF17-like 4Fe-4S cluster assembly/insertion protein YgfZ [Acinetobacter]|uniref:Folate-binding Fe/S cluster repair protein n=1 Tax=Acinetobacter junii TaxID=40215 RepID=A0A365PKS0_ACIJU|nr:MULTISPECIES: folate-binding Fe/S cluster repair protein [Acinetobacter]RBA39605.1 folate-binding Fe/S cluster repair protein [Acinetobacter junii]RBA43120.1 folate-binding Fe/S cluster repair protein [Acinetobacter junii]RBA48992.1 folate-binding Fe/S cluster repair protein [Acinetobacter junii]WLF71846.1 folate-binding Fe/S cluster repair protein [Acinetobacter junii]